MNNTEASEPGFKANEEGQMINGAQHARKFVALLIMGIPLFCGAAMCQESPLDRDKRQTRETLEWLERQEEQEKLRKSMERAWAQQQDEERLRRILATPLITHDQALTIQRQLSAAGFDPGPLDGRWGPQTKAAVIEFQRSHDLSPDGIVGPQTAAALKRGKLLRLQTVDRSR